MPLHLPSRQPTTSRHIWQAVWLLSMGCIILSWLHFTKVSARGDDLAWARAWVGLANIIYGFAAGKLF